MQQPATSFAAAVAGGVSGGAGAKTKQPRPRSQILQPAYHIQPLHGLSLLIEWRHAKPTATKDDLVDFILDDAKIPGICIKSVGIEHASQLFLVTMEGQEEYDLALEKLRNGVPWTKASGTKLHGWSTLESLTHVRVSNVPFYLSVAALKAHLCQFGRVVRAERGKHRKRLTNVADGIVHFTMQLEDSTRLPAFIQLVDKDETLSASMPVHTDIGKRHCYKCGKGHPLYTCKLTSRPADAPNHLWSKMVFNAEMLIPSAPRANQALEANKALEAPAPETTLQNNRKEEAEQEEILTDDGLSEAGLTFGMLKLPHNIPMTAGATAAMAKLNSVSPEEGNKDPYFGLPPSWFEERETDPLTIKTTKEEFPSLDTSEEKSLLSKKKIIPPLISSEESDIDSEPTPSPQKEKKKRKSKNSTGNSPSGKQQKVEETATTPSAKEAFSEPLDKQMEAEVDISVSKAMSAEEEETPSSWYEPPSTNPESTETLQPSPKESEEEREQKKKKKKEEKKERKRQQSLARQSKGEKEPEVDSFFKTPPTPENENKHSKKKGSEKENPKTNKVSKNLREASSERISDSDYGAE